MRNVPELQGYIYSRALEAEKLSFLFTVYVWNWGGGGLQITGTLA